MPVAPIPAAVPQSTTSFTGLDVVSQALLEIGVFDPSDGAAQGADAIQGITKLNRLLDSWNADGRHVYAETFVQYPMVPGLQPHTIGPKPNVGGPLPPTFIVNQRPVKISNAQIILNSSTSQIRYPVNIRDKDWWANERAFTVPGTLPTDLYYEPDWPNGSLFLWPVPIVNSPIELVTWQVLQQLALATSFSLPPGYLDAIVYSLAEALAPSYHVEFTPGQMLLKNKAMQRIEGPNLASPRISTRDWGMPGLDSNRTTFNYKTGMSR